MFPVYFVTDVPGCRWSWAAAIRTKVGVLPFLRNGYQAPYEQFCGPIVLSPPGGKTRLPLREVGAHLAKRARAKHPHNSRRVPRDFRDPCEEVVRHRWITEAEFRDELYIFVDQYNKSRLPEPFDPPPAEEVARAAATVVSANETIFGRQRFRELVPKCAFAFYELCKQHFFFTANKRIATFFLLRLLERHGFMLDMDRRALARFAERVAASDPADRTRIMKNAAAVIRKHVIVLETWTRRQEKKRERRRRSSA